MAAAPQDLLTAEEFARLPDNDLVEELSRGKIIAAPLPGFAHGYACAVIAHRLGSYLEERDMGHALARSGVITQRDPDTVRGPDATYYSYERLPRGPLGSGYGPEIPELVFEVLGESDRWLDLLEKVVEYLKAGSLAVALIDPETRAAHVYRSDAPPVRLEADDALTFPDVLPGFQVIVGELFG